MNILITGANGFLGSWLSRLCSNINESNVFAGIRSGADISLISDIDNLNIVELNYKSRTSLLSSLSDLKEKHGSFDLVIHNAGLTKSMKPELFMDINLELTQALLSAIKETSFLEYGTFSYVSSQAALGPVGFGKPVSAYGHSKLAAEKAILDSGLSYLIFRPTGIYGPGDKEFLALFKSVKKGLYPCAAPVHQKMTLIHVCDVAQNIIDISLSRKNKTIHLGDGKVYEHKDMKTVLDGILKSKSLFFVIPNWVTKITLRLTTLLGKLFGFDPILSEEKHFEITKDWDHDFSLERKEIPLKIKFDLMSGFKDTYDYYQSKKLV
ncbi:MAG: NAD-dependent epimerase/dehydratase family protein [Cyclobacteriaceae bacterium]